MRIPSGVTDQSVYFVAVDATDLKTRETGLTSFTVYRSRDGGAATAMTTPTVSELDATNMPGVYRLLLDEDMTISSGNDSEEVCYHITQASMAPVTRTVELYRPKITAGYTLGVAADGSLADQVSADMTAINGVTLGTGAVPELGIIESGTAQSATSTTLVVRAASPNNTNWTGSTVMAYGSTQGYWQARTVVSNASDTLTVDAWDTTPSGTVTYLVYATPPGSASLPVEANVVQLGGATQSATDLKDFADECYDPVANTVAASGGGGSADWTASEREEIRGRLGVTGITSAGGNTPTLALGASLDLVADQIGNIAIGSSAISTVADSYTLTTGTQAANAVTDTQTINNIEHHHTDVAGTLDLYYEFTVGGSGVASSVEVVGRINGGNDDLDGVYAYDWTGAVWDRVGDFNGRNNTTNKTSDFQLLARHTGVGANTGKVRVRFYGAALSSANLYIDRITANYAVVSQSVGYANGAVWINTGAANTDTELYVDGVADNPVSSLAAAKIIADQLSLRTLVFAGDATYTIDADYSPFLLTGAGQTVTLSGAFNLPRRIERATIIGGTNTGAENTVWQNCAVAGPVVTTGRVTMLDSFIVATGSLTVGNVTMTAKNTDFALGSYIDLSAVSSKMIRIVGSSGSCEVRGLSNGSTLVYSGHGRLDIHGSCTGGTIYVQGNVDINNLSSVTDLRLEAHVSRSSVNRECDTAILDSGLATAASVGVIDANVDAILADTGGTIPAQISALNDISAAEVLNSVMTESYAPNGVEPTLAQAVYAIQQILSQFSISGTSISVKRLDNSTTAFVMSLDDPANPTGSGRS